MKRTFLRKTLLSDRHLLITKEAHAALMLDVFPLLRSDAVPTSFFYEEDPPTYKEEAAKALAILKKDMAASSEMQGITVTDSYSDDTLPESSIAYHRIFGFITANSNWFFSSKQLEIDLLQAEKNPAIGCHFLHVCSPGGQAWYMDRLSETMRSLSKPIIVLVEMYAASAAYYIACHGNAIFALTNNDIIGSIGTMISTLDFTGYYEKLGIKEIEEYSNLSSLKNKKERELLAGHPEQYKEEVLDPLSRQFIDEVRANRQPLKDTPDDTPVFQGESFDTVHAIENGLIDGKLTFNGAILYAADAAGKFTADEELRTCAINYINN